MTTLFWICALVGGGFILLQGALGLIGLGGGDVEVDDGGDLHAGEALDLLSVRAVAAAVCIFGLTGLAAGEWGLGTLLAVAVALAAGVAAALGVALAMRAMRRMETDAVVRPEGAVGQFGTVYLSIPGGTTTPGKIHLVMQGRTVEMNAVSRDPLPTGAPVIVVDVVSPDTLEVAPQPLLGEFADVV